MRDASEVCQRKVPLFNPAAYLLSSDLIGALGRIGISPLASGHQNPTGGIMELQVVISHSQPAVRVPSASRSDIEQSATRLGENITTIGEVQFDLLSHPKRLRENHGDKIVSTTGELRSLDRLIMYVLDRLSISLDVFDLQEARELKQQRSLTSPFNFYF